MIKSFLLMLIAFLLVVLLAPIVFLFKTLSILFHLDRIWLSTYFKTIAIGLDQLGGAILYNKVNWTISGYTGYLASKGDFRGVYFAKFIDMIFGENHCKEAYDWDCTYDAMQELKTKDIL